MQSDNPPSNSTLATSKTSPSKTPVRTVDAMAHSSPQPSPRISTLRRAGADLFSSSRFSSTNPFDADEFEFEVEAPLSATNTQRTPPPTVFHEVTSSTAQVGPSGSTLPATPTAASRLSTLRRRGNEVFASNPFSSSNPFDPDDDEFGDVTSTQSFLGRPLEFFRAVPYSETLSSAKATRGTQTLPPSARLQDLDGREVEEVTSAGLPLNDVQPSTPTRSPRVSTLRRAGEGVFTQMSYSASNPFDADDEEFADQFGGMQLSATQRIRGNPLQSVRGRPTGPPTLIRGPLFFDGGSMGNIRVPDFRKSINWSPTKTYRHPSFADRWTPEWLKRRSSPRTVLEAPTKSELYRTSKVPRGKEVEAPVKSMWDADDDEFDRWPGQETLNRTAKSFRLQHGTFHGTSRSQTKTASSSSHDGVATMPQEVGTLPAICGANLTEQEHADLMHELLDKNCGNPDSADAHDEVMRQFYSHRCAKLPPSFPARHMHIINRDVYVSSQDTIVKSAMPRLCDAVATVLYHTSPKCLEDFLDPSVKLFEWRREGTCVMIRRKGNEVIAGTYHNFGTSYVWTYFVRSVVSLSGTWTETYAAVSLATTPISERGIEFDSFDSEPNALGISPTDPKYALFMGRDLALFLLNWQVWNYRGQSVSTVRWEADGRVTFPMEYDRYQLGTTGEAD